MELLPAIYVTIIWHVVIALNSTQEIVSWKPQKSIFYKWRWFIENRWKIKYTDNTYTKVKWYYKLFPFITDGWHMMKYLKYSLLVSALTIPFILNGGLTQIEIVIFSVVNTIAPAWVHNLFFKHLLIRKLYRS